MTDCSPMALDYIESGQLVRLRLGVTGDPFPVSGEAGAAEVGSGAWLLKAGADRKLQPTLRRKRDCGGWAVGARRAVGGGCWVQPIPGQRRRALFPLEGWEAIVNPASACPEQCWSCQLQTRWAETPPPHDLVLCKPPRAASAFEEVPLSPGGLSLLLFFLHR